MINLIFYFRKIKINSVKVFLQKNFPIILISFAFGFIASSVIFFIYFDNKLNKSLKVIDLAKDFLQIRQDVDALFRQLQNPPIQQWEDPAHEPLPYLEKSGDSIARGEDWKFFTESLRKNILNLVHEEAKRRANCQPPKLIEETSIILSCPSRFTLSPSKGKKAFAVTISNIGTSPIKNPQIFWDGKPPMNSVESLLKWALAEEQSNPEERAIALWDLIRRFRIHDWPPHPEASDPVKLLSIYGYGFCSNSAEALAALAEASGLFARVRHFPGKHVVTEIFLNERWCIFDTDGEVYYRNSLGQIATLEDLLSDPQILKKYPSPLYSEETLRNVYLSKNSKVRYPRSPKKIHQITFDLRPGESITWSRNAANRFIASRYLEIPKESASGLWQYTPVWSVEASKNRSTSLLDEAYQYSNLQIQSGELIQISSKKPSWIVYRFLPGYPIVDGWLEVDETQKKILFSISRDGKTWKPIKVHESFFFFLNNVGQNPDYELFVRAELPSEQGNVLKAFKTNLVLQMAPRTLPLPSQSVAEGELHFNADANAKVEIKVDWE